MQCCIASVLCQLLNMHIRTKKKLCVGIYAWSVAVLCTVILEFCKLKIVIVFVFESECVCLCACFWVYALPAYIRASGHYSSILSVNGLNVSFPEMQKDGHVCKLLRYSDGLAAECSVFNSGALQYELFCMFFSRNLVPLRSLPGAWA